MDKHVARSIGRHDEPETFHRVEPLRRENKKKGAKRKLHERRTYLLATSIYIQSVYNISYHLTVPVSFSPSAKRDVLAKLLEGVTAGMKALVHAKSNTNRRAVILFLRIDVMMDTFESVLR